MTDPKHSVKAGSQGSNSRPSNTAHDAAALSGAAKAFINRLPRDELIRYVNGHPSHLEADNNDDNNNNNNINNNNVALRSRRGSSESIRSNKSRSTSTIPRQQHVVTNGAREPSFSRSGNRLSVPQSRSPKVASPASSSFNITAALAASRASPVTSNGPSPHQEPTNMKSARSPAPPSVRRRTGSSATAASAERLDETSIPPTTSLVEMFEQHDSPGQRQKKATLMTPSTPAALQSTRPVRRLEKVNTALPPALPPALPAALPPNAAQLVHDRLAAKGLLKESRPSNPADDSDGSASLDSFRSAKEIASPIRPSKPPLPLARKKINHHVVAGNAGNAALKPEIQLQPPSREASGSAPVDIYRPSSRRTSSSSHCLPASHPSIIATYHQLHPRHLTPLTTGDSLANAIVASSLASSRAQSPHVSIPPPAGRAKAGSLSHSHHSLFSRTPSPPKKGMRHTMRSYSSSSSDDEDVPFAKHKKKKKFLRKHPNKHHEGDRKRWRDAITERERKRYEGLWAANKGIHVFFTPEEQGYLDGHPHGRHVDTIRNAAAEQITNVVARDIWSRSRLPDHILEQVWELVDTQVNGRLLKEEFVVGLWLIDQCLKGRKLPARVTDSVWNSVRFLHGIKVRKK